MLTPETRCRLSGLENRNEFAIILPPSSFSLPALEKHRLISASSSLLGLGTGPHPGAWVPWPSYPSLLFQGLTSDLRVPVQGEGCQGACASASTHSYSQLSKEQLPAVTPLHAHTRHSQTPPHTCTATQTHLFVQGTNFFTRYKVCRPTLRGRIHAGLPPSATRSRRERTHAHSPSDGAPQPRAGPVSTYLKQATKTAADR